MKDPLAFSKNSRIILLIFWASYLFQVTILRYIWSIENISRVFNAIIFVVTTFFVIHVLITKKYPKELWRQYLLPGVFIFIGVLLNILISATSNLKVLAQLGSLMPWIIYLLIPFFKAKNLIDFKKLWKYSYYFMLIFVILGLLDYYLIFIKGIAAKFLDTPYGPFLAGKFSVLYVLKDGSPHFRFYACFAEPGSLAMMLLPFIAYSYFHKKYFGMFIFLVALYITFSLGGLIGLVMLLLLIMFYKAKKKMNIFLSGFVVIMVISISYNYLIGGFNDIYSRKGDSSTIREGNFKNGILNFSTLVIKTPLGIPLTETTEEAMKNNLYIGSNFIPVNYLQKGGIIAFIGYILILILSIKIALKNFFLKKEIEIDYIIVSISILIMIPFLLQRTTIWESPLFAFLFSPVLLDFLSRKRDKA